MVTAGKIITTIVFLGVSITIMHGAFQYLNNKITKDIKTPKEIFASSGGEQLPSNATEERQSEIEIPGNECTDEIIIPDDGSQSLDTSHSGINENEELWYDTHSTELRCIDSENPDTNALRPQACEKHTETTSIEKNQEILETNKATNTDTITVDNSSLDVVNAKKTEERFSIDKNTMPSEEDCLGLTKENLSDDIAMIETAKKEVIILGNPCQTQNIDNIEFDVKTNTKTEEIKGSEDMALVFPSENRVIDMNDKFVIENATQNVSVSHTEGRICYAEEHNLLKTSEDKDEIIIGSFGEKNILDGEKDQKSKESTTINQTGHKEESKNDTQFDDLDSKKEEKIKKMDLQIKTNDQVKTENITCKISGKQEIEHPLSHFTETCLLKDFAGQTELANNETDKTNDSLGAEVESFTKSYNAQAIDSDEIKNVNAALVQDEYVTNEIQACCDDNTNMTKSVAKKLSRSENGATNLLKKEDLGNDTNNVNIEDECVGLDTDQSSINNPLNSRSFASLFKE